MSWRPIDFQGVIDLDRRIVEQLELFLQQKENRLANQILHVIQLLPTETTVPILPTGTSLKLSEAVEGLNKKIRLFTPDQLENPALIENGKLVVKEINQAFWEYTEMLEGCVTELFQQIRHVPVDRWHLSIAHVVQAVQDMLIHRFEDLIWAIRRLEKPLKDYFQNFKIKPKGWFEWRSFGETYVDPDLIQRLNQTEKSLKTHYESFNQRYTAYMALIVKTEDYLNKMKSYPVLARLDVSDQNIYVDVFRLLKMLELNQHAKKEIAIETSRALKNIASVDHICRVFRTYLRELKESLFKTSLEWKSFHHDQEDFKEAQQKLQNKTNEYQEELQALMQTMSQYRTFILKNDPNPYVRSRLGFSEWIVGPESPQAKKMLNLIYSAEELNGYFKHFSDALTKDTLNQQQGEYQTQQEIEKLLHEMGQPLISSSVMRNRAEKLLDQLKECDELGSPHLTTIHQMEDFLSRAMREDWKYHSLHQFPLFHQIYRLHQGLVEYIEDPAHAFRLERFRLLFDQIEEWVEKEDVYAHVHEIEIDINDMKTYLQDFLASVQRAVKEKSQNPFLDETLHRFRQQLLEYRYLFGQFFSVIKNKSPEGLQLRNQFLFVDQYFETVEGLIHELKMSWESKR